MFVHSKLCSLSMTNKFFLFPIKGMGQKKKSAPRREKKEEVNYCVRGLYFIFVSGRRMIKKGCD